MTGEKPEEKAVPRLDNSKFRIPASSAMSTLKVTKFKRRRRVAFSPQLCVLPNEEE